MDTLSHRIAASHLPPHFVVMIRRGGPKPMVELWIAGKFHRRQLAAEHIGYTRNV